MSKLSNFSGHCTEFNVGGGVIQRQSTAECNNVFPKCEGIYNSTDAYKCMFERNVYFINFLFDTRFMIHEVTSFLLKYDKHKLLINLIILILQQQILITP